MALQPAGKVHVDLRPNCGICNRPMKVMERFDLLFGDLKATRFTHRRGPFIYPDQGYRAPDKTGVTRCRQPDCKYAYKQEAATVHHACFEILSQRFNVEKSMDHLVVVTTWQTPWFQAHFFRFKGTNASVELSSFNDIGLPLMKKLPMEILQMIHNLSSDCSFWQFNAASQLGRELSAPVSDYWLSLPASSVLEWKRGSRPITVNHDQPPIFLITIDARGLEEIRRLPTYPAVQPWRTEKRVYIVADKWKLAGVIAHFKFGYARFEMPTVYYGLQTWDTPTPPLLSECQIDHSHIRSSTSFKTIDLNTVTGLTFFYSSGAIFAIHAHTEQAPHANETLQLLSPQRRQLALWFYIPLDEDDTIDAIGVPTTVRDAVSPLNYCIFFRMRLAGDVIVGLAPSFNARVLLMGESTPSTLIYEATEQAPITVLGAYCPEPIGNPDLVPLESPSANMPPFANALFSFAPLRDAQNFTVFSDGVGGACLGMLIEYDNGAKRSVGQCRLGIDHVEHYICPQFMCICPRVYMHPVTKNVLLATVVSFHDTPEHQHTEEDWSCFTMMGTLEFWFSDLETNITVAINQN